MWNLSSSIAVKSQNTYNESKILVTGKIKDVVTVKNKEDFVKLR